MKMLDMMFILIWDRVRNQTNSIIFVSDQHKLWNSVQKWNWFEVYFQIRNRILE